MVKADFGSGDLGRALDMARADFRSWSCERTLAMLKADFGPGDGSGSVAWKPCLLSEGGEDMCKSESSLGGSIAVPS